MVKTLANLLFDKIDKIIRFDVSVQALSERDNDFVPYIDTVFLIEIDFVTTNSSKNLVEEIKQTLKDQCFPGFYIDMEYADDDYFKKPVTYFSLTVRPKL